MSLPALLSSIVMESLGGIGMGMRLNGNETELFMVSVNNIAAANVISFSLSGYIQICKMTEFEATV